MNVFGKNERSWRKARKRGVSPIIATILLVAITVVLAAVLYVPDLGPHGWRCWIEADRNRIRRGEPGFVCLSGG